MTADVTPETGEVDRRTQLARADDGRTLCFAEWGDPDGVPVVGLHGTPGCRLSRHYDEEVYGQAGVRHITYDRAGYGRSDRLAGRSVAHAAADVRAIADTLGLDRFALWGGSGGGPHALACAALLPDRVTRVASVVGVAPYDAEDLDFYAGMTQGNVDEFGWTLQGEDALRPKLQQLADDEVAHIDHDPLAVIGSNYELPESDKAILMDPRRHAVSREVTHEMYRHGIDGWIDDDLSFVRPWGFSLEAITVPTSIWYGPEDSLVPAGHNEWLASRLPAAEVFLLDGGHLAMAHRIADLLAWLRG